MASTNQEQELQTEKLQNEVSTVSQLKDMLLVITNELSVLKNLGNQVKLIIKDVEKQSKDLEKLRNKKSRNKSQRKEDAQPSGITKPVPISDDLAKFLGVTPGTLVPRNEVTKGVSEYVRRYELFDPTNKQKFLLNTKPEGDVLFKLLGTPTEGVTYFNLQKYLKPHYIKVDVVDNDNNNTNNTNDTKVNKVDLKQVGTSSEIPVVVQGDSDEKKKKKIVIKKKKESLNEEV